MKISRSVLATAVVAIGIVAHLRAAVAQPTCTNTPVGFSENFSSTTNQDTDLSSVGGWGSGTIKLQEKGSFVTSTGTMGTEFWAWAPVGDVDGDGYTDMVIVAKDPSCHIHYVRNKGMVSTTHDGFDLGGVVGSSGFTNQIIDSSNNLSCSNNATGFVSGDYNGDGLQDFLYYRFRRLSRQGDLRRAYLYLRTGVDVNGFPTFTKIDVRSTLSPYVRLRVNGNPFFALDLDGNGTDELMMVGSIGSLQGFSLTVFNGSGFATPSIVHGDLGLAKPAANGSNAATGTDACPPARSRGASGLAIADFDDDGDFDVVTSSVSETDLSLGYTDGLGNVTFGLSVAFSEGGALTLLPADYDGDGDVDLVTHRDSQNCGGSGGTAWLFENQGGLSFVKDAVPIANLGTDTDYGVTFNVDNDSRGYPDLMFADRGTTGAYTLLLNTRSQTTPVYNLEGTAVSTVLDTLDNQQYGIVAIQVTNFNPANLQASNPIRTADFYVSNNGGQDWEQLLPSELPPTSATHNFTNFGADFRYKVEFTAEPTLLTGNLTALSPATTISPELSSISGTYYYVDRQRYSRSGLAYGRVEVAPGDEREILVSASFFFPGYQGTVRAFDITSLTDGSTTALNRVDTDANVTLLWDAGNELQTKPAAGRVIYGGFAAGGTGDIDDRVDLTISEMNSPTTTPALQDLMNVDDTNKEDVLNFVIGDRNTNNPSNWKLFDLGHSTPMFVGAPVEDPAYLGPTYAAFATANASRTPVIYIGANDGFLHAFNAADGAELWAYAPNNLLSKLKIQKSADDEYEHQHYVDGRLLVTDVYDDAASSWKTVLVGGQAQGWGKDGDNYYFGLDVTNPTDPRPLWEFGDGWDGSSLECSGDPCSNDCTQTCDPPVCNDTCTSDPHVFSYSATDGFVMEAENANSNVSIVGGHNWVELTLEAGYSGDGYMLASPNSGVRCNSGNATSTCGAALTYEIVVTEAGTYYPHFRVHGNGGSDDSLMWGLDGTVNQELHTNGGSGWNWHDGASFALTAGEHTFNVWMREDGQELDKIVLSRSASNPSGFGPAERCELVCLPPACTTTCVQTCISNPDSEEWAECGVGLNRKCCEYVLDGVAQEEYFCQPVAEACGQPDPVMGETWSPPAIGKVRIANQERWLVFFASGYDNRDLVNVGRAVYALDAVDGTLVARWDFNKIPFQSGVNPSTIDNTMPGGVSLVDLDNDAFVDRLYVGDLEGRLWKVDLTQNATLSPGTGLVPDATWPKCVLFDAGDPDGTGTRVWAPIITTPGIAIIAGTNPNIYFGTGGDDRAPDSETYKFYSVYDGDAVGACRATPVRENDLALAQNEWVIGDGYTNTDPQETLAAAGLDANAEGDVGDRYWSDPLIVNNKQIFFAALNGKIESVNPCLNLTGGSKIFGVALTDFTDGSGNAFRAGQSLFGDPFLEATSKIRTAAIIRSIAGSPNARIKADDGTAKDVFFQELTGSTGSDNPKIQQLSSRETETGQGVLRIIDWREVPL